MAKKPVKTIHPLVMAKSLEEQNQVVSLFISKAHSIASMVDHMDLEMCREKIRELGAEAEKARRCMWPEGDD